MNNLKAALKVIDEMENEAGGGIGTPEREYTIAFSSDLREVLAALCSEPEGAGRRCSNCNYQMPLEYNHCPNCGIRVSHPLNLDLNPVHGVAKSPTTVADSTASAVIPAASEQPFCCEAYRHFIPVKDWPKKEKGK